MRRKAKACYGFEYDSVDMEGKALGISAPFIPLFKVMANHMSNITRTCDVKSTRLRLRSSVIFSFRSCMTKHATSKVIAYPHQLTTQAMINSLLSLPGCRSCNLLGKLAGLHGPQLVKIWLFARQSSIAITKSARSSDPSHRICR